MSAATNRMIASGATLDSDITWDFIETLNE